MYGGSIIFFFYMYVVLMMRPKWISMMPILQVRGNFCIIFQENIYYDSWIILNVLKNLIYPVFKKINR